jgi:PAS domain S-box-containing protein
LDKVLRVLNIEDSEPDFLLLVRHLESSGYELIIERVDTAEAMKCALESRPWDVILADYSLPRFSALAALSILKEVGLDVPLIIISGTIGEELAVNAMLAGADDYLMKDNLARLAPAIERERAEARSRRARREAEDALKESESQLRALFAAITDLIIVTDAAGRCVRVAPTSASGLYAAEELIGKTPYDLYTKGKADFLLDHIHRALKERRPHQLEYSFGRHDHAVWFEGSVSPMSEDSVIWIARDVTERKRAEHALRESEERYRLLFENYPDPTYVFELDTLRLVAVNEAMVESYGYSRNELLSMTVADIWPPDAVPAQMARVSEWRSTHGEKEWKHRKKDGSILDVEITSHPLFFDNTCTFVVQAQDVTTRKLLEAQLRQSQRMEAIGQLAGGVAHDFNNLLTIINGYSELALEQSKVEEPLRRYLEEIHRAGTRAASLTSQLLAFSRKQVMQPAIVELNVVIREFEKMLHRLIGEDIELRTVLNPELGYVKADPGQLEQVIMNLAINARDAMPEGGKLTISTGNVQLDEEYVRHHIGVLPGFYVLLSVTDTGIGMDSQTQARIFEPFFTTKQPGKGTGLGLSTVYGIVNQSGGHIWVRSELGHGTTFEIYLPRINGHMKKQNMAPTVRDAFQGTETILLVEDDETVRRLARTVLVKYGYSVLEAESGDAAILIGQRYPDRIHLLVTDLVMPEINGRELYTRLMESRRDLKVLYMSGYTDKSVAPFVQKPFTPETFACVVRELLAQTHSEALQDN